VVEADLVMPVAPPGVHAVVAQDPRPLGRFPIAEHGHAALAGGHQLVGEEAEGAGLAEAAGGASVISGTD
jgi:hypothetical protein